jgi:hypothetical protein
MNPKKAAYLQELQLSRLAIERDLQGVRDEFDLGKKAERIVRRRPLAWLAGAGVGGFLLATWRRPAPKVRSVQATKGGRSGATSPAPAAKLGFLGLIFAIFKMVFPMARPLLSAYASRRLAEMAMSLNSR